MDIIRGIWEGFWQGKFKGAIYFDGSGIIVEYFSGVYKPMCKDSVLDVSCLVNADTMWRLNYVQVQIEELWTLLGGYREVLVGPNKGVLE